MKIQTYYYTATPQIEEIDEFEYAFNGIICVEIYKIIDNVPTKVSKDFVNIIDGVDELLESFSDESLPEDTEIKFVQL